jgi:hypothetical protein
LLSTTILAFMMMGINSIISSSAITKDEVIKEDRDYLQVITALNRFEIDFTQIYSPLYHTVKQAGIDELSKDGQDFSEDTATQNRLNYKASKRFPAISRSGEPIPLIENPDKETISFFTTSNRRKIQNSKESRFAWVRYTIGGGATDDNKGKGGSSLIRNYKATDPFEPDLDFDEMTEQVLLRGVKSIEFSFYDKNRKKWVERLSETGVDSETPKAIQIKIVWANEEGNELEFIRSFRPLWPNFNTIIDEQERKAALKPNDNPGGKKDDKNSGGNP